MLKGAKVYKIVDKVGQVYYGSTCDTLQNRLKFHVNAYNSFMFNGKGAWCYSFLVIHNRKFKITIAERCKVKDKQELKARERYYIETFNCINHNIPARSYKEIYQAYNHKPERIQDLKRYYQMNKDRIRARQKEYQEKRKSKENQDKTTDFKSVSVY